MSDIDADLLALAGDESDSDDGLQQTQVPAPGDGVGDAEASDDEVAMDESDGEAPEDGESETEQSARYPVEGKYKSEAERQQILAMPEIEREQLLADRAEENIREEQSRKLKAIWSGLKQEKDKKRKASDSDLRDDRKSTRQKTVITTSRSENLAELQRKRAEKANRPVGQPRKVRRSETPEDNRDASGEESEHEWGGRDRRDQTPEEEPPTKRDFDRIKVGRTNFAKVCFYPGFEDAVNGCFVRVSVGPDPTRPGQAAYRMAKIEGIVEKAPYSFPNDNGKLQVTTQHVVASIGKTKREAPFIHCSMSEFEPVEVDRYLKGLSRDGTAAPKKSRLADKTIDLNALINRRFTNEDLDYKLSRSSALVENFKKRERERLERQKAEAEEVGETEKVERIQESLDKIDKGLFKMAYNTTNPTKAVDAPKKSELTEQQRLAELNRQNLKNDREVVRKALLAETRAKEKRKAVRATAGVGDAIADKKDENGALVHNIFKAKDDLELPYPEWTFNYIDYSNKYLGSRAMRHLAYDDKGRAVCDWPREMCDDEVIARMDIPLTCIVPEYD